MGVGLCASSHLGGTLTKLNEFGKSDAFKKASGIFGLLKVCHTLEPVGIKTSMCVLYLIWC